MPKRRDLVACKVDEPQSPILGSVLSLTDTVRNIFRDNNRACSKNIANKPAVAIVGKFQNGKSTLVNCLLGGCYAVQGIGLTTTHYNARYSYGEMPELRVVTSRKKLFIGDLSADSVRMCVSDMPAGSTIKVSAYSPFLEYVDVIDSPGWGGNKEDDDTAVVAVESADAYIYVVQKALDQDSDLPYLRKIAERKRPMFIVLNCVDDCDPASNQANAIATEVEAKLQAEALSNNCYAVASGHFVLPVNLLWAEYALRCASEADLRKIDKKIRAFLDGEDIDRGSMLIRSGILPLRQAICQKLSMLTRFPGSCPLGLMDRAADIIQGDLVNFFRR